ncbi:MAG: FAD/NAD(P)-binding protein [Candidatus Buchananbacteria bacterium]
MNNPYLPLAVKILSSQAVSADTKLLTLQLPRATRFDFKYLQFIMAGLPGWGEAALSLTSSPEIKNTLAVAVRQVGGLTTKLQQLKPGNNLFIRGPFGNGLAKELLNQSVLLIGGGCGFIPLRPIILDYTAGKLPLKSLQTIYGCKNQRALLFTKEQATWQAKSDFKVILEQPEGSWPGKQGLITELLNQTQISLTTKIIMVGPPLMYKFVLKSLLAKKVLPSNIYLSLERKMYCGLGVCQHCAIGPYYVCKDGPVFTYEQLKNIPEAI